MTYRFLRKDYDALVAKIDELADGLRKAGREKGLWAGQSAETWHDNFGYEQERRRQWALSQRRDEFVAMKNGAEVVEKRVAGEVDVGSRVTIRDRETGERRTIVVGSYQVLDKEDEGEISYAAPLAKPFLGATVGEEREVVIRDRRTTYEVVEIE